MLHAASSAGTLVQLLRPAWARPGLRHNGCCPPLMRTWATYTGSQVLIAGAGPTGMVLALHLAKFGIPCTILEKGHVLSQHPQAHFINNRTMEVFRHLDGLADEVHFSSPPLDEWRRFVYCRSMAGQVLGEVDHFKGHDSPINPKISPEPLAHLPQNRLLPLLLQRILEQPLVTLRMGQAVTSVQQAPDGVNVKVQGPDGRCEWLSGAYLAAADGANSGIRESLGIAMQGDLGLQHLINIHFFSRCLGELAAARPGMLYFVFNANVIAVLVAHTIQEGEFVAQVPFFPPLQTKHDFSHDVCTNLIMQASGLQSLPDVHIKQIRPWTMSAQVASRFRDGRTFLLGDAAHRFPPAGGFGMNTGVQDAHNLAWKLASVLHGNASKQLLDSYEAERRQVAEENTALSVSNWKQAIRIPQALGLDPGTAATVSKIVSSAPLPQAMGKPLLEGAFALGRSLAAASLGPMGAWRQAQLDAIFASGESLKLQFPREDLGFKYQRGAVLPHERDVHASSRARSTQASTAERNAPYLPSSMPGCRLPHCWLLDRGECFQLREDGPASQLERTAGGVPPTQLSTLDLVAEHAPGWLLLLDCTHEEQVAWEKVHQAVDLAAGSAAPLQVVVVLESGQATGYISNARRDGPALNRTSRVVYDAERSWCAIGALPGTALLVRPDGHVAWRLDAACTGAGPSLVHELEVALFKLLTGST